MKLLSLTLKNYRVHRELSIDFDPGRNLIGGPNESGKSTVAEAIHRAFFFRHKSGGEVQRRMRSELHTGHPEVKLVFEADDRRWTLEKRFSGTSGTALLTPEQGQALQGDEAEEQLARLTGNPDGASGTLNQLAGKWSHLWVWQGISGDNAAVHTAARRDELVQRLQDEGLSAVIQSASDEQVREHIRKSWQEIHTRTGAIKAGSKPEVATKALAAAEQEHARAAAQLQQLHDAITEIDSATNLLREAEANLPGLREQKDTVVASLETARELQSRSETQKLEYDAARKALEQLQEVDKQIRTHRRDATAGTKALEPKRTEQARLSAEHGKAEKKARETESARREAATAARRARLLSDLAAATVERFERSNDLQSLNAKAKEARKLEATRKQERESLAKLPALSDATLKRLRKLDGELGRARSALDAIAAKVEVLASDGALSLDGDPMSTGDARVITEPAELVIAENTRLSLQPGGGTSLDSARKLAEEADTKLRRALDEAGITDLEAAEKTLSERQLIESRIQNAQTKLDALGADDLSDKLDTVRDASQAAEAEVERRMEALGDARQQPTLPDSLEKARSWRQQARETQTKQDEAEQTAVNDADARSALLGKAADALTEHRASIEEEEKRIGQLTLSADLLEQQHGEEAAREDKIDTAGKAEQEKRQALEATTGALAKLKPEALLADRERLDRAIERQQQNKQAADRRIAVARATLEQDGSTDPEAELLRAEAQLEAARQDHDREQRRARAIDLLHRLFESSHTAINESLTRPIADRVESYLERVLGHGVRVGVDFTDPDKPRLELARPGTPSFPFDQLSGGAREQVAAAVRLATAEILAGDHDDCLPLVFDDAFAYADPSRIQALQGMLDLAATQGLQLIVLSCTPSDYSGFGAREVRLTPPQPEVSPTPTATTPVRQRHAS